MDYSAHNRLIELAASDDKLRQELAEVNRKYALHMQKYLIALAESFGIEVTLDCFCRCDNKGINDERDYKLKLIGLILKKKPELRDEMICFSRENERKYAAEKVSVASKYGVNLDARLEEKLSMWTGIM